MLLKNQVVERNLLKSTGKIKTIFKEFSLKIVLIVLVYFKLNIIPVSFTINKLPKSLII